MRSLKGRMLYVQLARFQPLSKKMTTSRQISHSYLSLLADRELLYNRVVDKKICPYPLPSCLLVAEFRQVNDKTTDLVTAL